MNIMKKTISAVAALLMVFCCFTAVPLEVFAVTSTDNFTFELDSKGEAYILTGVTENLVGEVVVPDFYNGLPVTTIDNGAFTYCEDITSITIPETVTTIEGVAFQKCTSLQTINLPKTIKSITSSAFNYCDSLQNITIDNDINGCGNPFIDKYGKEKGEGYFVRNGVLFANYNTYVDNYLVTRKISHNSLIKYPSGRTETIYSIPGAVMEIQSEAFSSLVNLEAIIIPASVISFYVRSFRGLGEPHEKALTIVMQHDTYPTDISSKAFQNLYPGTQVILKNDSLAEAFNSRYSKIVYDFLYDEPGVSFVSASTRISSLPISKTTNTLIDNENLMIHTTVQNCSDITEILGLSESVAVVPTASCVNGNLELYGTGTVITVFDGNNYIGDFTLIVEGDLNGDSVCNVLDTFEAERASNGHIDVSTEQIYAANGMVSDELNVTSYQNVVNIALVS